MDASTATIQSLQHIDFERYSRHLALPDFSPNHQLKLKQSKVAVVGAGGLGNPVLQYLAAAGVGYITVIDPDSVQLSNLQRQILFATTDQGKSKASCACARLAALNPHSQYTPVVTSLKAGNALQWLRGHQLIIDCTDNFPARYLLNDCSVLLNIPLVFGSVFRWEGQVAVFNYQQSATYRDLYPEPPLPGSVLNCEEAGVLGLLTGIIGCLQANEAIKILTGIGTPLANQLLVFDAAVPQMQIMKIPNHGLRDQVKQLIDYDEFCGIVAQTDDKKVNQKNMKEVTVQELKALMDSGAEFQLIDVREPHEYDACNLGGELIPMAEVPHQTNQISKEKKVIVHCRSGRRS
jgi:adenylyltransferase/sulfurtransferase